MYLLSSRSLDGQKFLLASISFRRPLDEQKFLLALVSFRRPLDRQKFLLALFSFFRNATSYFVAYPNLYSIWKSDRILCYISHLNNDRRS